MSREIKAELSKAIDRLERLSNKNNLGYGERVCIFCDARGTVEIEHTEICPIGDLWGIVNEKL